MVNAGEPPPPLWRDAKTYVNDAERIHCSLTPGMNTEPTAEGQTDYAASNGLKAVKKKLERVTRPCRQPKMACFL
jgi:hypothetical protein